MLYTGTRIIKSRLIMEGKIKVYGTKDGKLYIEPEELFALPKVQDEIRRAVARNQSVAIVTITNDKRAKNFEKGRYLTSLVRFLTDNIETKIETIETNDLIIGRYDEVKVTTKSYKITIETIQ